MESGWVALTLNPLSRSDAGALSRCSRRGRDAKHAFAYMGVRAGAVPEGARHAVKGMTLAPGAGWQT